MIQQPFIPFIKTTQEAVAILVDSNREYDWDEAYDWLAEHQFTITEAKDVRELLGSSNLSGWAKEGIILGLERSLDPSLWVPQVVNLLLVQQEDCGYCIAIKLCMKYRIVLSDDVRRKLSEINSFDALRGCGVKVALFQLWLKKEKW